MRGRTKDKDSSWVKEVLQRIYFLAFCGVCAAAVNFIFLLVLLVK